MRALPLIIILLILDHIAFAGSRIAVSLLAIRLESSALTVGTLIATYALLPALLSVSTGRWIDRIGLQRPMLVGTGGLVLGILLPVVWPALPMLYLTSVVVGTSFMLVNLAAYHAVGELSAPEDRPANFSYVALGFATSGFIAPLITGLSIDHIGFRLAFAVLAMFALMSWLSLLAQPLPTPPSHADQAVVRRGPVWDMLREPPIRRLFVTMAVLTLGWDIFAFAIPVHGSQIGLSASQIGIVMGAFSAASFAVRLAMPFISSRVAPWTLLFAALVTAGVSFLAIPFVHGVGGLMAILFLLGLGLGAPQPVVLTLLHQMAPPGRGGELLGLRTTLINTGQTVMPLVFGALGAALGMAPLFFAMAVAMLVTGAATRRIRPDSG